jgi:opacity protein-like surface antigen
MKKLLLIVMLMMVLGSLNPAAAAEKLQISANNANVRSQPELNGEIVLKAGKGDVFTIIGKEGAWYKIRIPAETGSQASEGYIHVDLCAIITGAEIPLASKKEPASSRPAKKGKAAPANPRASEKLFSGYSAKFGLQTSPKTIGFGDRWLLDLGRDWGINPFLAVGLELQPYFHHISAASLSMSIIGANLFVNAKGGVNIGRFVEKLKFLTPYVGLGLGGAFASTSSKFENEKVSRTDFNFAWHLMFGLEVALKNLSLILEIQTVKISDPELSPDTAQHFLMLGIRF